jgi:hypothetical protein
LVDLNKEIAPVAASFILVVPPTQVSK